MHIVKNMSFLKVSGKMDCTIEFSVFFLHILAPVKNIVRHFLPIYMFDTIIIKASDCICQKQKKIQGHIFFDISKVRKSHRGLLGRQNCILS